MWLALPWTRRPLKPGNVDEADLDDRTASDVDKDGMIIAYCSVFPVILPTFQLWLALPWIRRPLKSRNVDEADPDDRKTSADDKRRLS